MLSRFACDLTEAPPGVDDAFRRVGLTDARPFVLFVGKVDVKSKGFSVLEAAFHRLERRSPDLKLVVTGSARGNRSASASVQYVPYVASRSELAEWYAAAAVTVLPSTSTGESFGMVIAEALTAGCPVIGTNVGGVPLHIEDGRSGRIVPANDVVSLAAAIEDVVSNNGRYRSFVRSHRSAYVQRYEWRNTTTTVARSLEACACGRVAPENHRPVRYSGAESS